MLGNYSKFVGAIVGAILAQIMLRWTGIDVHALGVAWEFNALVVTLIDGLVMAAGGLLAGVVTYWFPANRPPLEDQGFEGENV